MALSLFLRNASKIQATRITSSLLKSNKPLINSCSIAKICSNSFQRSGTTITKLGGTQLFVPNVLAKRYMSAGDHTALWKIEKLVSVVLLAAIPGAFIMPSSAMDNILAVAVTLHIHWGLEAIATDYVRPVIFGPMIPKIAIAYVYFLSIVTLAGLLYHNHHDIGITNTVKKIWSIKEDAARANASK